MQFFYTRLFSIRTFLNILSTTFAQPFTGCPQPFAQPPQTVPPRSNRTSPLRPHIHGQTTPPPLKPHIPRPPPIKKIRLQKRGGHLPKKTAFPAFQPNLRFENFALKFKKKLQKASFSRFPIPKKPNPAGQWQESTCTQNSGTDRFS